MPPRRKYKHSPEQFAFNEWHRLDSIKRFLTPQDAAALTAMDGDLIEYDYKTHRAVLLHEVAIDVGQERKETYVIQDIARQVNCRALCTLYTLSDQPNPADTHYPDISSFRVRDPLVPGSQFITLTPRQYAQRLNATAKEEKAKIRKLTTE